MMNESPVLWVIAVMDGCLDRSDHVLYMAGVKQIY